MTLTTPGARETRPAQTVPRRLAEIGLAASAVAAGAVLLEAAILPGLAIGAAAMLAPRFVPGLRRRAPSLTKPALRGQGGLHPPYAGPSLLPRIAITRSVAKTVTFRVIVTTLDFTTNYVVLGELTTAAGLSAFGLVVSPLFYLLHETSWNYVAGPAEAGARVNLGSWLPRRPAGAHAPSIMVSRTLAKTITFRTFASAMDFTTNYVVVRDLGTAGLLTLSGFVLGPFVYYGHEMAWERLGRGPHATAAKPSSGTAHTGEVCRNILPKPGERA